MYLQCHHVWVGILLNVPSSFSNPNLIQLRNYARSRSKLYVMGRFRWRRLVNVNRVFDGLVRKWYAFLFNLHIWIDIFGFNTSFEKFVWKVSTIRNSKPWVRNEGSNNKRKLILLYFFMQKYFIFLKTFKGIFHKIQQK